MKKLKVAVFPVALVPSDEDQLQLMAFAPGGDFLRADVGERTSARECAQALLGSGGAALDLQRPASLEEVAFTATDSSVTLIYTAVLPLVDGTQEVASLPGGRDLGQWVPMTPWIGRGNPRKHENLPPEQAMVRNYWRRQLEETSAVLEFLPRYFTTYQVRAAYSSLWGEEQHVGAFHRWLHEREEPKTPLVTQVDEEVVRNAAEDAFMRALKDSDLGPQMKTASTPFTPWGAVRGARAPGVGLSAAAVAASGLGFLPMALFAGAVVGGRVAYQQKVSRGKKPLWFTRALPGRILIDDPYAPRPRWLPTGDTPAAFH